MSNDRFPAPGGKLTAESFADLAVEAAQFCSGVTLVLTAMDDQDRQVGQLFVVEDLRVDPQARLEALDRVVSVCFGRTMESRLRVAFAFVEEDKPGILAVRASISDACRVGGLN